MAKPEELVVDVIVLDGVSVGMDPDEAAAIVRAVCDAAGKGPRHWGVQSLTIERRRLTARVRFVHADPTVKFGPAAMEGVVVWLREHAEAGRALYAGQQ